MRVKDKLEELLNIGHLTYGTSELYSLVLEDETLHEEELWQLRDSLCIMLGMLENGNVDWNSYYTIDEIVKARRLIKKEK